MDIGWVKSMIAQDKSLPPATRRLRDAVQRTSFNTVALNKRIIDQHTNQYSVELAMGPITDQKNSGRCWIFAGLNMVRSKLIAEDRVPKDFEFSENYLHFFNMLEKANRYLEKALKLTLKRKPGAKLSIVKLDNWAIDINDGGWFDWFPFLAAKYGLVPRSAMSETSSSNSTPVLNAELKASLAVSVSELFNAHSLKKGLTLEQAVEIKKIAMRRVWKILTTHLGIPPVTFDFRQAGKPVSEGLAQVTPAKITQYTPQQFAKEFVQFNPADYVAVTNNPGEKIGQVYSVKKSGIGAAAPGQPKYNLRFMNLGADRLEDLAVAAIDRGQPVYFASAMGKDVDRETGIMHPQIYERGPIYGFSRAEKGEPSRDMATFLQVLRPNHAMVLTGYDRPDPNGPVVKFKVENSWGEKIGTDPIGTKGIFHMYRDWMRRYVYEVIIPKALLSDAERKAWAGKAKYISEEDVP